MNEHGRPAEAAAPPRPPYDVAVLGAGRVGGSIAAALRSRGHSIRGVLGRRDDPSPIATATVIVVAVPDDELAAAAAMCARLGSAGAAVIHTCGIEGIEPLRDCGELVAAVHPAVPVATAEHDLTGAPFGVTCEEPMRAWAEGFVRELGGVPFFVPPDRRTAYHAALAMASNFAVAIAGDAADLLGGHDLLVPLLRATVENLAALGPHEALTGPVVRGDVGTVLRHVRALPSEMIPAYVENARRALALARRSGRLTGERADAMADALESAMAR